MRGTCDFTCAMIEHNAVADPISKSLGYFRAQHGIEQAGKPLPFGECKRSGCTIAKMVEVGAGRTQHRKAAVRIAQRQWHRPCHRRMAADFLCAFPADVVGRLAHPEDRIQHQLHGTGSAADHQVGAGYRLRETLSRVVPDAFNTDQHHHTQCNRGRGQSQRQTTVPCAFPCQHPQVPHRSPSTAQARLISGSATIRSKWVASRRS